MKNIARQSGFEKKTGKKTHLNNLAGHSYALAARGTWYETTTTEQIITAKIKTWNGGLFPWGIISYLKLCGIFSVGVYFLDPRRSNVEMFQN